MHNLDGKAMGPYSGTQVKIGCSCGWNQVVDITEVSDVWNNHAHRDEM
jgi:hypothetical protein